MTAHSSSTTKTPTAPGDKKRVIYDNTRSDRMGFKLMYLGRDSPNLQKLNLDRARGT